jgi:ABC-type polysaccharide/polyol phosphate transport system ATPase subunit
MENDLALAVRGLWKRYGLPIPRWLQKSQQWADPLRNEIKAPGDGGRPWVLRDINLEVRRGETLAIIGRNGAAKSTLLKILAGVTPPTRGHIERRGRLFPMIEITGGLHQELTGRENIRLIGAIMGVSRKELARVLTAIEDFTELDKWLDEPIRTYSTGMIARLGFGVGACVPSDIVLIDEALSVGDLAFQNKCLARIRQMREQGAAIVLVTHSLDTAQFIAQRGLVLDDGRIVASGSCVEALRAYEELVFSHEDQNEAISIAAPRARCGINARMYDCERSPTHQLELGEPFGIEIAYHLVSSIADPIFSLAFINAAGVTCVLSVSAESGLTCPKAAGPVRLRAWYNENHLMKGHYRVDFVLQDGSSLEILEQLSGVLSFSIVGSGRARGVVAMTPRWDISFGD